MLIERLKDPEVRAWYIHQAVVGGWSRDVLRRHRLKIGAFKAEYAGKMNLYLYLVDYTLRHSSDQPSIGLILCQVNKRVLAEYTLRGMDKPIGISEYELTRALPTELASELPTVQAIEAELADDEADA